MGIVLVVEDNRAYAHAVVSWLRNNNICAYYVLSMDAAKSFLCKNEVHMVFSNSKIEKSHGIQLLEWMKIEGYYIPFFIMAEHIDIQEIVDAIKKGTENYFQKPIQTEKVLSIINDVLGRKKRNTKMRQEFYMGQSPLFLKLQYHIRLVAPVDMTVLIRGASGTGKEWVASHIHALSKRSDAPFIAVDCGTLPKELAASELFGYVKALLSRKSG